VKILT